MKNRKNVYCLTDGLMTNMNYAVYGNKDRFQNHKHAWKVWKTLKEFGCKVYPVAKGLSRLEGSKVYSELAELQGKVDAVVLCLMPEYLTNVVKESYEAGAKYIWFQEKNWTKELQEECELIGLTVVRGCVLKHKTYKKPFAYLNPCYWHGWKNEKVPERYYRL
ncbi:MAG: CoA-binding protein [Eubacteriales bacterium]